MDLQRNTKKPHTCHIWASRPALKQITTGIVSKDRVSWPYSACLREGGHATEYTEHVFQYNKGDPMRE